MELHIRGPFVQLCSHWRRLIGGLGTAVLGVVVLAAPALASGTLELNPSPSAAGDELLISGRGFEASEQVKLKWDGSPIGPPVRADANGEFTAIRSVPIDALPGKHTIIASGLQSGVTAEAPIEVLDPAATTTTTFPAITTTSPATTTTSPAADEKTTTSLNTTTAADGNTTTSSDTATDNENPPAVDEPRTAPAEATPGSPVEVGGVAANVISTGPDVESVVDSGLGSVLTTPIGLAIAAGIPLFVAITVWWMYRKPNNDEQESME